MTDLVQMGLYELVWNHPPLPAQALLAKVASPHARRTYQEVIELFYWRVEREPRLATPPAIAEYLGVTRNCYPPRIAALHLRIVRELYDEGVAAGIIATNPVTGVRPPEFSPDPPLHIPTRDAAAQRLPACRCDRESGRRERALCLTVCNTAIRPEELRTLQVGDFFREPDHAGVNLHIGQSRARMAVQGEVADALDTYLAGRAVADDSPLFGLSRCRAPSPHRLTPAAGTPRRHRPSYMPLHPMILLLAQERRFAGQRSPRWPARTTCSA